MEEAELCKQLVLLNKELEFCQEAIDGKLRVLRRLSVDIEKIVMKLNKEKGKEMKIYWVYHNWVAVPGGKATIHKAECSFCQYGRGVHGVIRSDTGTWYGPLPLKDARRVVRLMKKARGFKKSIATAKECSFCMK